MVEEFTVQQSKAPFNMAISTLERISEILRKIRDVDIDPFLPLDKKQLMKTKLTRQLFVQASPLLEESIVDAYKERFLALTCDSKLIMEKSGGSFQKKNEEKIFYSQELDVKLDLFSLDIQRELQREKYFMPPKKDMGSVVGSFR